MHKVKFALAYIILLFIAYLLRRTVYKIATNAINEQRLDSGIFSLFPVEGERAVELAKGYIRGVNITFWFLALFFPLLFILSYLEGLI